MHWKNNKRAGRLSGWFVIILLISGSVFLDSAKADCRSGFMLTDKQGSIVFAKNENKPLVPASILKIVTSLAAIGCLGENYKYKTQFYYDPQTYDLYVKGFGDPLFISEEINKACRRVAQRLTKDKITDINHIILDNSYFEKSIAIPGKSATLNPYDAFQGALCANFNTVFFKTDDITGKFISAEEQTPLLPVFSEKIRATGLKNGRIVLSEKESRTYPGLLIQHFLKKNGIIISGSVTLGKIPTEDAMQKQFLFSYSSDTCLTEIIKNLLKYSNNFMANQILLTLGGEFAEPPSSLEKSIAVVNIYLTENFPTNPKNKNPLLLNYVEGSGISRKNRITCESMIKILIKFMPDHELLRKDGNVFYKTGTLSDVRSIAGYIEGRDNALFPFVIMINKTRGDYKNILDEMKQKVKSF